MSTLADTPRVPLEIAENIMDNLDTRTLRSCALTCRGWLPRARFQLMASIHISTRDDVTSIDKFLHSNPLLATAVRSVSVVPISKETAGFLFEAFPVSFLSRLPNLQECRMCDKDPNRFQVINYHPITLIHMKTCLLIEELTLYQVMFRTGTDLARLLSSLTHLRHLTCQYVEIRGRYGTPDIIALDMVRFRNKCRLLSKLTVCTIFRTLEFCADP